MKLFRLFFFVFLFGIVACNDKPMGESDDLTVELEKLVFDRFYSSNETPNAVNNLPFETTNSNWNGNLQSKDFALYLSINQPSNFDIPLDPDAPDTLPAKVNTIEVYLAIYDEQGNILSEKRTTAELKSNNRFVYEMPPMTFRNLSVGKHLLKAKVYYKLIGKNGTTVGNSLAEWSWEMPYFMPKIYKSTVSFDEFRLSDVTYAKSKENNDGLGNPLPDLFWSFSVNHKENFKSSTYENSNPYLVEKLTFNIYHLEEDPIVTIQIYDDDYTSFNDKIASWNGKLASFRADDYVNVPIKGLDFFKIKTSAALAINDAK